MMPAPNIHLISPGQPPLLAHIMIQILLYSMLHCATHHQPSVSILPGHAMQLRMTMHLTIPDACVPAGPAHAGYQNCLPNEIVHMRCTCPIVHCPFSSALPCKCLPNTSTRNHAPPIPLLSNPAQALSRYRPQHARNRVTQIIPSHAYISTPGHPDHHPAGPLAQQRAVISSLHAVLAKLDQCSSGVTSIQSPSVSR